MGMTPEVLAEAHKPLFSTKGARGTGLGLPVSIDVVKSVGGRLWLESEPNQGTRVHIELPAAGEEERDG
jgi:signal transduction histidine kinase